ncbi:MAG: hypothetical protein ACE5JL_15970 [Dehalococcoidia bacterium]
MISDCDWNLADDSDFPRQPLLARFCYRLCDLFFDLGEWFAWGRFSEKGDRFTKPEWEH